MDNLVYEETINSELSQSEFTDKQWLYVNDNNNGSYSSQIVLDTTALANSGGYINWSEAFIALPLVLQLESAGIGAAGNIALDSMIGMKNGFWNMIHSLTCEFNNGNIIQQVPFLNVFCSFKNLTSWSQNDLKNWGAMTGFCPDSNRSWLYNQIANANTNTLGTSGYGFCNNRIAPYVSISIFSNAVAAADPQPIAAAAYNLGTPDTALSCSIRQLYNAGFQQRVAWLNYDMAVQTAGSFNANQGNLLGQTAANQLTFQSYIVTATTDMRAIAFDAVIRLKDIADFFGKCPLLKGSSMRIYLNTNQCFFSGSIASSVYNNAAGAVPAQTIYGGLQLTSAPIILGGGATNPIMIASMDLGQGAYPLGPIQTATVGQVVTAFNACVSIVKTQFTQANQMANVVSCPINAVRLYAPCYTMSPIAESRLLSLTPTKKVLYNDIFQYQFSGVQGNFNLLVTNGISNVRSVTVVPLLAQANNGVAGAANYAGVTTDTLLSPFSTTGGTPDPIQITNFNIQVSGKNLFLQQLQYNFETFYEQIVSSNQLNGSLTTSLSSGLIGFDDWSYLYRYYYGNVSRSLPSEDGVAKAIQILGSIPQSSATPYGVNLMVFVEFQREITIDLRTGARVA